MTKLYHNFYFLFILLTLILLSCESTKVQKEVQVSEKNKSAPVWITDSGRRSTFPDSAFISQLGTGLSAQNAQQKSVELISQFISSSVKSLSSTEFSSSEKNGKISESYTVYNSAQVASDNELYAVKYTTPYFSESENTYYCVAYIDKAECIQMLKPKLNTLQTEIIYLMQKADNTNENFYKILFYSSVLFKKDDFYKIYDFYRIVNEDSDKEFLVSENCFLQAKNKIVDLKDKTVINVSVTNDFNFVVYNAICSVFNDTGFTISKSIENYSVMVAVTADISSTSGGIYESFPFCQINVLNKNKKSIYSFDIQCKKSAAFDKKTAQSKAYKTLEKQIKLDFEENLLSGI